MPEVYREHDALLFPSLNDSGGQVVLEALSHGKPVICLDLGGPGTIVTNDCGRVVATGGRTKEQVVAALADALQEISDSPLLRQRLSQAALARARGYDWPIQVQAAYAAITDVLAAETGAHDRPGQRQGR